MLKTYTLFLLISIFLLAACTQQSQPLEINDLSVQVRAALKHKLIASDGAASDFFGNSVAISGNTAVVGVHSYDGGTNLGAAYVFKEVK